MSKIKLSKTELAALDALIASFQDEGEMRSSPENLAFITAIARVTVAATKVVVKATPYVADATALVAGAAGADAKNLSAMKDAKGNIDLNALIKLREEAS